MCALVALFGCASKQTVAPVRDLGAGGSKVTGGWSSTRPDYHVVKKGDTLYSISWQYGGDYRELARWNGVRYPYTIYVGQRLRLRPAGKPAVQGAQEQAESAPARSSTKVAAERRSSTGAQRVVTVSASSSNAARGSGWRWPAQGQLANKFSDGDPTRKGIDIVGKPGQEIRAAGPGRVVYSGSGLVGYGKLIIIKHDKKYLSAYGYNRRLLVKEGEQVNAGQRIAEMGKSADHPAVLHFEIRRDGIPVDPLELLPRL